MMELTDEKLPNMFPYALKDYSMEEIKSLSENVSSILAGGKRELEFENPIEEIYTYEEYYNNRQSLIIGGFIALVIYNLFLLVDQNILADVFMTALIIRLGVFSPLAILLTLSHLKRHSSWIRESLKVAIIMGAAGSFIYLAAISRSRDALFYFPAIILVVVFGNIFIHLKFFNAIITSAILFLAYAIFFPVDTHLPPEVYYTNAAFLLISIMMTLFANYYLERERRYSFLLSLQERLRRRILFEQNIQLNEQSTHDALTGLANRREVENYLKNLDQFRPESLSIIMLDIDYFKQFNDMYGHTAGDSCLQQTAMVIANSIHRKRDLAGRYGGEEFIVILPETSLPDAEMLARNIVSDIALAEIPHAGSKVSPYLTISAGVAYGEIASAGSSGDVLKSADQQLYRAKKSGRNRICSGLVNSIEPDNSLLNSPTQALE